MARQRKPNTPEKRARIGERIKVAATQAGLSLKDLAEQASVAPSSIYQYVRGITAVPPALVERIAAITRVHESFFDPELDPRQTLALPMDASRSGAGPPAEGAEHATRTRLDAELRQARALADAYSGGPSSRAAYLSALERLLALARALDSRDQQALVLAQIGRVHLEAADLPAAAAALDEARELAESSQTETWGRATLDLAECAALGGDSAEAARLLNDLAGVTANPLHWLASVQLGRIASRSGASSAALSHFEAAAEALASLESRARDREGQTLLLAAVAELATGAGWFEAAGPIWNRVAMRAERDRDAARYVEAAVGAARCAEALGDFAAARDRLREAAAIAAFGRGRPGLEAEARGALARVQIILGDAGAARANARSAMRAAHQTPADAAAAAIAMALTQIAGRQYGDAQEVASELLGQAIRTETGTARGAAHLALASALSGDQADSGSQLPTAVEAALRRALGEARAALSGGLAACPEVRLDARLRIAELSATLRTAAEAEAETVAFLDAVNAGLPPLISALPPDSALTRLLAPEIDLPTHFQGGGRLDLPMLEWRVHLLRGTLAEGRGDLAAACSSFLNGAVIVWRILSRLAPADVAGFQRANPRLAVLVDGLARTSAATGSHAAVQSLLERTLFAAEQDGTAVIGSDVGAFA